LLPWQFEVFCQFFIGSFDQNGAYVDTFGVIAKQYLLSPSSFGFDFATSLPWSYTDLYTYKVSDTRTFTRTRSAIIGCDLVCRNRSSAIIVFSRCHNRVDVTG
jgi:hypothetical protein